MRHPDFALTAMLLPLLATTPAAQAQVVAGAAGVLVGSAGGVHGPVELAAATHDVANRAIGHRIDSGEPIYQGDLIATGPGGGLQVLLVDQTVFSIGENARMTIDALAFDPLSQDGKIDFNVEQGTFRFVSGQIAAAHPENVTIRVPEGSIGIRGTIVAGAVGPDATLVALLGPGSDNNGDARNGAILVRTPAGAANITRTGYGTLLQPGLPPTPPAPLTPAQRIQLGQTPTASVQSGGQGGGLGTSSATTISGQSVAAGQSSAVLVSTSDGGQTPHDIITIINTGPMSRRAEDELSPVSTLAHYTGGSKVSAYGLEVSSAGATVYQDLDYVYSTNDSLGSINAKQTYTFRHGSAGGIVLSSSDSSEENYTLTLNSTDSNGVKNYSGTGSNTAANLSIYDYGRYNKTFTINTATTLSWSLDYSSFGLWHRDGSTQQFGAFSTGVTTPLAQMPGSGTATYTGGAVAMLGLQSYSSTTITSLTGTSSLTANFSSGTISGSLVFSSSTNGLSNIPSNLVTDLTITLGSTSFKGSNTFSGTATLSSSGTTITNNSGNTYTGTFYGTTAAEVAGTAQASGTTSGGTVQVVAAYGAKK